MSSMDVITNALKKRPLSPDEIEKLIRAQDKKCSKGAAYHRRRRLISKLEGLRLVEERGGKFYWYIYVNLFHNETDYEVKLKHSFMLIPGLRILGGIPIVDYKYPSPSTWNVVDQFSLQSDDFEMLEKCAEAHLIVYPEIFVALSNKRKAIIDATTMSKAFESALMDKLKCDFGELVKPLGGPRSRSTYVNDVLPSLMLKCIRDRLHPPEMKDDGLDDCSIYDQIIEFHGYTIGYGCNIFEKLKEFIYRELNSVENTKKAKQFEEQLQLINSFSNELMERIRALILRIKGGEPLKSECDICPKVLIEGRLRTPLLMRASLSYPDLKTLCRHNVNGFCIENDIKNKCEITNCPKILNVG